MIREILRNGAIRLAVVGITAVGGSAAAETIEVDVQFHNSVDLGACRTWSWGTGTPAPNYQVEAALHQEIELRLAKKGAKKTAEGGGCLVATGSQRNEIFPAGTLVIEIYETSSQRLAWSAVAAAIITDDDPAKVSKVARKVVKKAFAQFPQL
jgi:hypothetical protein